MAKMIDGGAHAGSVPAPGRASPGDRSSVDGGERDSLTRERAFAELENHPPEVRRNGSEGFSHARGLARRASSEPGFLEKRSCFHPTEGGVRGVFWKKDRAFTRPRGFRGVFWKNPRALLGVARVDDATEPRARSSER